jgi:hypothetical protein
VPAVGLPGPVPHLRSGTASSGIRAAVVGGLLAGPGAAGVAVRGRWRTGSDYLRLQRHWVLLVSVPE